MGSPTLIGSESDAATWSGGGEYYWQTRTLSPSGTFNYPTAGSLQLFYKTTYKINNAGSEALIYNDQHMPSYETRSITITN
jgi:hypothetical protein